MISFPPSSVSVAPTLLFTEIRFVCLFVARSLLLLFRGGSPSPQFSLVFFPSPSLQLSTTYCDLRRLALVVSVTPRQLIDNLVML